MLRHKAGTYSVFSSQPHLWIGRPTFGSTGPALGDAHGVFSAQGKAVGLKKEGVTEMDSDVLIVNCAKSCHQGNNEKLGMVVLTCNPSTQEAKARGPQVQS